MSISRSQDFIRGSAGYQSRLLTTAGVGVFALACAAVLGVATLYPVWAAPDGVSIAVEVPYVGPGVAVGTKVILHGQTVGRVSELDRTASESVRMQLVLDAGQIDGLTDEFQIDYRPENYFGTSAVNILATPTGRHLEPDSELQRTPRGDFTMSTMIEQGSSTIDGTLTSDLISSFDKSVHYLDGATPWIETGVLIGDRIAKTQYVLPSELLSRFNDIVEAAPEFSQEAIQSLMTIYDSPAYNRLPDGSFGANHPAFDDTDAGLVLAGDQLFGQAGALLASHGTELTPLIGSVTATLDVLPHLSSGGLSPESAREIVQRLNSTFVDGPDGKQLRLRVVLDSFPAMAAPLGLSTGGGGTR